MQPNVQLLQIHTSDFRIELRGPANNGMSTAPMTVTATAGPADVQVHSAGKLATWKPGQPGPFLAEDTAYWLTVESLKPTVPVHIRHRDPTLISNVHPIGGHPNILVGTINFLRQVGNSEFTIHAGDSQLKLVVEVLPTKIDYRTDYLELVHDLNSLVQGLAFEYLRATYLPATLTTDGTGQSNVEWLTILSALIAELQSAFNYIQAHPVRALVRQTEHQRADRVRGNDRQARRALQRGVGKGPWLQTHTTGAIRSHLPSSRAVESLDTAEHRWLGQQIIVIVDRLRAQIAQMERSRILLDKAGRSHHRLDAEIHELESFSTLLTQWAHKDPLAAATRPAPPGFTSLVLLGQPGYRDAYRIVQLLTMSLSVDSGSVPTAIKDIDQLYEIWCFLQVVNEVCAITNTTIDPTFLIQLDAHGISVRIKQGQHSTVSLDDGTKTLHIRYNLSYDGLTGRQKPDIVIEVHHHGWPQIVLILDAKYRLDTTPSYIKTYGAAGPPRDAVNVLHRYRDAITVQMNEAGLGRPVVRGAILFPPDVSSKFEDSKLWQSLEDLGIGAIPLLPSSRSYLNQWLKQVLHLPPTILARPGVPYIAYEHALRSQLPVPAKSDSDAS